MANLNLGQDVANKRERKYTAAKFYPLYQIVGMRRCGSLFNINRSGERKKIERKKY